ncbi:MAG TPA: UPF0182 family protein, partial [Gemmatimonadaceae bacterium]|nr:UPF0182 family protein [Gemmatimonadaceae bacterium]
MTRDQRLAVLLVAAAALLLVGRGFALVYVDHAWYTSLGATSVWQSKLEADALIYLVALGVGTAFVFLNLTMVRRSIVALVLPARIGNIEVGNEIPSSRLAILAGGMSVCAAAISALAVPLWTTVALWQSNVWFNEADPYFGLDLGYYVAWLPLEWAIYVWAFIIFTIVVMLVVTLYALTPSLKWERGAVHVTTHARRHITVLGALLVLFIAWGFRLDAYTTVIHGSGPAGMFTRFDHQWLVPTDLVLALVMVGASVVLFAAGWRGQTRMALATITAVILCYTAAKILPWISSIQASSQSAAKLELPYATTQRLYTAHAFPPQPHSPPSTKFAADTALLAIAAKARDENFPNPGDVVYPGAHGVMVVPDIYAPIPAPRVGGLFSRIMHAWGEQDASVFEPNT